jgi:hypothetical protein
MILHVFDSGPPSEWQWIGLVAGLLAFVVGVVVLPTVFQQFWGSPRLRVEYDTHWRNKRRYLLCRVVNDPVRNRLLRLMRVRASSADIVVQVWVTDGDTKKHVTTVDPFITGTKMDVWAPEPRTVGTSSPLTFSVAEMFDDDESAITADGRDMFATGSYLATVRVSAGETKLVEKERRFVVSKRGLYWTTDE